MIPTDALPLIGTGRLDRRLFDVALLRGIGYDDRRDDLPVIVVGSHVAAATARAGSALPAVGGMAMQVEKAGAAEFWDSITGSGGRCPARTPGGRPD